MGLYGNIIVVPTDADYWPPAHREIALTLDDVLIEDGKVAPFERNGDQLLGDGPIRQRHADRRRDRPLTRARRDEVVRFYLTNTANTRVFNVALPSARMNSSAATAAATSTRAGSTR